VSFISAKRMPIPRTIRSERKFAGHVIDLVVDEIEYPDGSRGTREVIIHPGSTVVVPIMADGSVVLVHQYRHPLRAVITELPAGKLDPNEDAAIGAARELAEETGLIATQIEKLTSIYSTPGFCDEVLHVFLATGLTPSRSGQSLDEGEHDLTYSSVPLDEAITMIERGDIKDAKSICGILLAERRLMHR
jgi:ADP-ribose pyrophosphatase